MRLGAHGLRVATVDVSELAKAEGGVTCCSLIFEASALP
jgi:N-dimethylarginine dimethylaminohydrolase